jgi:hypothetical protein
MLWLMCLVSYNSAEENNRDSSGDQRGIFDGTLATVIHIGELHRTKELTDRNMTSESVKI